LILPDAAMGSIIAAFIAGLVVFISTVLTKEQKTSEFRQVWIDELRKDIAQYMAGTSEVVALSKAKQSDKAAQEKFIEENFELIHELQTLEHRIILRLNPVEHGDLIALVRKFRGAMLAAYKSSDRRKEEDRLTEELLATTKAVLSREWVRVKRGEPTFQRVKYGALVALIGLAIFLFYALVFTRTSDADKIPSSAVTNNTQVTQIINPPVSANKPVTSDVKKSAPIESAGQACQKRPPQCVEP
jgi:hypothetical protein